MLNLRLISVYSKVGVLLKLSEIGLMYNTREFKEGIWYLVKKGNLVFANINFYGGRKKNFLYLKRKLSWKLS